jgi:hypothetical protein
VHNHYLVNVQKLYCNIRKDSLIIRSEVMKIIYTMSCFLFLFLSCCNNWEENPVSSQTQTNTDSIEIIIKLPYPEKTNKIFFLSGNNQLVGSSDGKFYKSTDDGKTWIKTGEIGSPVRINSFFVHEMSSTKQKYIYAGAENGIYVSSDMGSSWKVSYTGLNGLKTNIAFFEVKTNIITQVDSLYAFGFDGTNNVFITKDNGKNWSAAVFRNLNGKITGKLSHIESIPGRITLTSNYDLYFAFKGNMNYLEVINGPMEVMPNYFSYQIINLNKTYEFTSVIYKDNYFFASSKGGIYRGFKNNWELIALHNLNVNHITFINGSLFASTDEDIYLSNDFGTSWNKLSLGYKSESIGEIMPDKERILIIKSDGGVFSINIKNTNEENIFAIYDVSPKKGDYCVSRNVKLKWDDWKKSDQVFYHIEISTEPQFQHDMTESHEGLTDNFYQCSNLEGNTKYYWRVFKYTLFKKNQTAQTNYFTTE